MSGTAVPATNPQARVPLVVDLDGTLVKSDLLFESALTLLRRQPLAVVRMLFWLLRGRAYLKDRLSRSVELDASVLPYNERLLRLLQEARAQGRPIVLATASHERFARRVADHLGIFDRVLATSEHRNFKGIQKREKLAADYGERGFDYAGNAHDDLPVWQLARQAWVVSPSPGVTARATRLGNVEQVLEDPPPGWRTWLKAVRLHQWAKNILIFTPLITAHRAFEPSLSAAAALAFLCFGLCASGLYLANDLLDVADDRHHPGKRHRPFASGDLSLFSGLLAAPLLVLAAFALATLLLPPAFVATLGAYAALSLGYSLLLKRMMAVDVITLAMLYTLRIVGGGAACGIELTFWILGFSMFIFLSLALVKRYAELARTEVQVNVGGTATPLRGRGYRADDRAMVASLGAAAGYLSALVLALYIQDLNNSALYRHPELIWFACPLLLLWITRLWLLTHRGQMHDDPVVFALRDRPSLAIGAAFALVFWMAA